MIRSFFNLFLKILVVIVLFLVAFFFYFKYGFQGNVWPNTYFYGEKIGGKSFDDTRDLVFKKKEDLPEKIKILYDNKEAEVKIEDIGFYWDEEKTMKKIFSNDSHGGFFEDIAGIVSSFIYRRDINYSYTFEEEKAKGYLQELSSAINVPVVDGKFEIKNQKVVDFKIGSNGKRLLVEESIRGIDSVIAHGGTSISLVIEEIKANSVDETESRGIKELVASGKSSFAYSPSNRIHNISVGSSVFNGILIAPEESFSFIKYLGEVSAKTGYLPEMVIKEDKTIPEYGGGLCQVSTTFFRAAINAGLPILERTAHAYRVSYYEPAGMDSTIYQPKPDLVFKNDTGHYLLVQTRIEGAELIVDFYGTSDGRKVEVSNPVIYNITNPGEPIMVETTDLKPGEKKQIDTAHAGADAYFTRKIISSDGKINEEKFSSHYVPWRAKFLVGKEDVKSEPTLDNN